MTLIQSIDRNEVPFLNDGRWLAFWRDPVQFYLRADNATEAAIWAVIERRSSLSAPPVQP